MKGIDLDKLRESGRISALVREHCKKMIQPGAKLRTVAETAEEMIYDMGGKPAFPAQLSVNEIAAHYCSSPTDETVFGPNDIVKLDLGTHVDGYVTDNATTVDLQGGPNSALVAASEMALENAIGAMGAGRSLTEVGNQIEMAIKAFGFSPIYNLTGHGVGRYTIHCAPSIPNYPDPKASKLKVGQTVACEPFACDGKGYIDQEGKAEVFGLKRRIKVRDKLPEDIAAAVEQLENLPFARRTLMRYLKDDAKRVDLSLKLLKKAKILVDYPPLAEKKRIRVAQSEHTMLIHPDHVEVLTRTPASS